MGKTIKEEIRKTPFVAGLYRLHHQMSVILHSYRLLFTFLHFTFKNVTVNKWAEDGAGSVLGFLGDYGCKDRLVAHCSYGVI